jgi:predicted RNase H-like HicB family nuclease
MANRYEISIEPIGSSGVMLTIAELPRIVIFGETAEDALGWARDAIAFQLRDSPESDQTPPLELALAWRADDRPAAAYPIRRLPEEAACD